MMDSTDSFHPRAGRAPERAPPGTLTAQLDTIGGSDLERVWASVRRGGQGPVGPCPDFIDPFVVAPLRPHPPRPDPLSSGHLLGPSGPIGTQGTKDPGSAVRF
jgi:hypothetical protein